MMQNDNKLVARSIRFDIATGKSNDFHTLFQNEVLPILRKQDGFKDKLLLTNGDHVVAISLWTNADSAKEVRDHDVFIGRTEAATDNDRLSDRRDVQVQFATACFLID